MDVELCFLMVFESICNCRDELENTDVKCCFLTVFETAEKMLNTRSLKRPFWHYLKQYFRSAEKNSKTRIVNSALWWYLKRFGTAEKMFKTRSLKHAKFWHYLKQPFGNAEKILKTRLLSQAFWHYLKRYFVTAKIFFFVQFHQEASLYITFTVVGHDCMTSYVPEAIYIYCNKKQFENVSAFLKYLV